MFFVYDTFMPKTDSLLQLHPNPYFERKDFWLLDGIWDFAITKSPTPPESYPLSIKVPFAVETKASQVGQTVGKGDYLHYRLSFDLPSSYDKGCVLLHFTYVDQVSDVYLNGELLGHHEGGYVPFHFELGKLREKGNILQVVVSDDVDSPIYPRGKQSRNPHGIWYTATSGIYGSVYLEAAPKRHFEQFSAKTKGLSLILEGDPLLEGAEYAIFEHGELRQSGRYENAPIDCSSFASLWTPEAPYVYKLVLKSGEDEVSCQIAFRDVGVISRGEANSVSLNGKPVFLTGVLDQGYWLETGLTPPSREAAEKDIKTMKELGFNVLRKHIKAEPLWWYALCDTLGMMVIQDVPNAGDAYNPILITTAPFVKYRFDDKKAFSQRILGRADERSRSFFASMLEPFIRHLAVCPCIVAWTLFNEGWGQFNAEEFTKRLRLIDDTRLIDSTSGWYDQQCGDFLSKHVYFKKIKRPNGQESDERIPIISEFGGYSFEVKGHSYASKRSFGYGKVESAEELTAKIEKLYKEQIIPSAKTWLCGAIYTQLSDVENELNGLFTFDRESLKVDAARIKALNEELKGSY